MTLQERLAAANCSCLFCPSELEIRVCSCLECRIHEDLRQIGLGVVVDDRLEVSRRDILDFLWVEIDRLASSASRRKQYL